MFLALQLQLLLLTTEAGVAPGLLGPHRQDPLSVQRDLRVYLSGFTKRQEDLGGSGGKVRRIANPTEAMGCPAFL